MIEDGFREHLYDENGKVANGYSPPTAPPNLYHNAPAIPPKPSLDNVDRIIIK